MFGLPLKLDRRKNFLHDGILILPVGRDDRVNLLQDFQGDKYNYHKQQP